MICARASSLEPPARSLCRFLGKRFASPTHPPPSGSNGHQQKARKPYNVNKYQFSWGRVAFTLFHSFHSSWDTRIQDGYWNARRESFDPVPIKLAKANWIYQKLSLSNKILLLNRSVFTVSCCHLLFMNFTFLKNQYTMVEYKGALDVISKTFR